MLYGVLVFLVTPIVLPVLINIFKSRPNLRKYLWASPIAVLVISVLLSWAFNPYFFEGLFDGYQDASRNQYYRMVFFIPLFASVIVAAICHAVNRLRTHAE
jgi:Na+/proline symporter